MGNLSPVSIPHYYIYKDKPDKRVGLSPTFYRAFTLSMNRAKKQHFTPLMSFSLVLTASIITARYGYDYLSTRLWLISTIIAWSVSACCYVLTKLVHRPTLIGTQASNLIHYQCLNLYLCIFCLGGTITSHHIDEAHASIQIKTYQSLSYLERTILKAHDFREHVELSSYPPPLCGHTSFSSVFRLVPSGQPPCSASTVWCCSLCVPTLHSTRWH